MQLKDPLREEGRWLLQAQHFAQVVGLALVMYPLRLKEKKKR
jgi:hypothetical protein